MILVAVLAATGCRRSQTPSAPPEEQPPASMPVPGGPTTIPANAGFQLTLQQGLAVEPASLRITRDLGLILFRGNQPPGPQGQQRPVTYWYLALAKGEVGRVIDLIPPAGKTENANVSIVSPSPDGRYLAIAVTLDPEKTVAYVLDFAATPNPRLTPIEMASEIDDVVWVGNLLAIGSYDSDGVRMLRLLDPATGSQVRSLNIRAEILAASDDDNVILAIADPADMTRAFKINERTSMHVLALSASNGKVLRDLGPQGLVGETPVISARGSYVAFQSRPEQMEQPQAAAAGLPLYVGPTSVRLAMKVLAVPEVPGKDVAFPTSAVPLYVSDSGEVLAVGLVGPFGAWIRLYSLAGEGPVPYHGVRSAAVAFGRLIMASASQPSMVLVTPPIIGPEGPIIHWGPATTQAASGPAGGAASLPTAP